LPIAYVQAIKAANEQGFRRFGLLYWLIRRSAATSVASLFYLVQACRRHAFFLFGERLDAITGMARLRCRVFVVNKK